MKKILLTILVLLTGFLLMTNVKAEDDKTLVVELPSNEVNFRVLFFRMSIREISALTLIEGNEYIQNNEGKNIIHVSSNNNLIKFELLDGVTEEECIIDIDLTEETLGDLKLLGMEDVLDGYSKVQLVLKEMENSIDDALFIDLTHKDIYDNITSAFFVVETLFQNYFNKMSELFTISNEQNKKLLTLYYDSILKYDNNYSNDYTMVKVDVPDDVIEEDDIIVELTNQMKTDLNSSPYVNVNDYSNIIIKFSDKEYPEADNYILDVKKIDINNLDESLSILSYFGMSQDNSVFNLKQLIYLNNNENKKLFFVEMSSSIFVPEYAKVGAAEGVTYEDNIIYYLSDESLERLQPMLRDVNISNFKKVVIKLADPVFLEGKEQTYNIKDKDKMSFRLDIDYDKFLEYGKVYIDDKLVDAKNYEVSKGSTIITLNKDYVTKLNKGEHNIRVEMIDGEVTTTFNIVDRVEIIEPIVEAVNKIIVENPETGDKIIICSILLVLSLIGVLVFRNRRRV